MDHKFTEQIKQWLETPEAERDFHRWRTNEMLIATYKMAEKHKESKTLEHTTTTLNLTLYFLKTKK
ncbi:MAG: hypothetical protein HDS64_10220 [Bacteroidales bacterium]|nr:hypothetical protein [Bacteroidales bacterium]MBD5341865.1 hypothetical protein [Bacteroides sp.]